MKNTNTQETINTYDLILLVDDDPTAIYYNKIMLERAGYTNCLIELGDGRELVEFLTQPCAFQNVLVLLDFNMKQMGGVEAAQQIQRNPPGGIELAIFLLSTHIPREVLRTIVSLPLIQGIMVKPLSIEKLHQTLRSRQHVVEQPPGDFHSLRVAS